MPYTFYFEKLEVWHLAIELAKDIYQSTASFPREEKFGLTNQIRRASVSVSSNLAEGSARITKKDQAHFSTIAFSSLMEVTSQLYLSKELDFMDMEQYQPIRQHIEKLANKINAYKRSQLRT